jgi:hypothetical protein
MLGAVVVALLADAGLIFCRTTAGGKRHGKVSEVAGGFTRRSSLIDTTALPRALD